MILLFAVTEITDKISAALDNNSLTLGVFVLSEAFDTVDHSILITKLRHYGIRGMLSAGSPHIFHKDNNISKSITSPQDF